MAQFRRVSLQAAEWYSTGTSGANAALTVTKAAPTNTAQSHYITGLTAVGTAAAVDSDVAVTLKDGTTTIAIFALPARNSDLRVTFAHPIKITAGAAANLVVGAGGTSVVSKASLTGYTV